LLIIMQHEVMLTISSVTILVTKNCDLADETVIY